MERDYWAEEIESSLPEKDYWSEEVILKKPEPSESILQKALGAVGRQAGSMMMPEIPQNPFDVMSFRKGSPFTRAGAMMGDIPGTGGMSDVIGATGGEVISDVANVKNPLARGIIRAGFDPRTWIGGGKVTQMAGKQAIARSPKSLKGFGRSIKDVLRPRETSQELEAGIESAGSAIKSKYSKGLKEATTKYSYDPYGLTKGKTVSFLDELASPKSLGEKKLFDDVIKDAEFQKIDLNNMTLDESKRVMDMLKGKSKIFEKEVGPLNVDQMQSVQNMKAKQLSSFEEMDDINKGYAQIEDYGDLSGKGANILEGGGNRIQKAAQMEKLKNIDKSLYKRTRNYRRANILLKAAKNPIIQAGASIPIVGGIVKKIFGGNN